jgi:RNA polymerase sigma-70 factor (ECF subfamily)
MPILASWGSQPEGDAAADLDQLLHRIAERDTHALHRLYLQCRRSIFAVAYAVTGDYQLAEDVLQDTVIRVWEQASSYRSSGSPKAWIHTIARNLALDMVRQRQRLSSLADFEDKSLPDALISQADLDGQMTLLEGIRCLNRTEALVFVLKAVAGCSHLETARMLQLPYRQVRYRYQQALKQLRRYLSDADR